MAGKNVISNNAVIIITFLYQARPFQANLFQHVIIWPKKRGKWQTFFTPKNANSVKALHTRTCRGSKKYFETVRVWNRDNKWLKGRSKGTGFESVLSSFSTSQINRITTCCAYCTLGTIQQHHTLVGYKHCDRDIKKEHNYVLSV